MPQELIALIEEFLSAEMENVGVGASEHSHKLLPLVPAHGPGKVLLGHVHL